MSSEPLTRESFLPPLRPITKPKAMTLLPTRVWTEQDWERIRLGYGAADMDEKWHVVTEDRTVCAFRSWTGREIYAANFAPCDGGWRIASAVVETKRKIYRSISPEFDATMLYGVLSGVVLGEEWSEPGVELVSTAVSGVNPSTLLGRVALHHFLGNRSER
ncbi:hypothetical protein [Actinacidiphila epipremni]|uniref:Uncharacterized protein n=1 Tax=Actinacidiphila epipremni TaxID=2053013 RepID=A0ABX0ZL24_9ACTN|nr:hypothetical protein [Actinacidiphila epipremni]NJP43436.1 hypothetical protein [Actinacidiphila epipremni]